jgi:alkylmercury lyase
MVDDALAAAVRDLFPRLSRIEQRISVALYRLLAEGQPVAPRALAERVGLPLAQVVQVLGNWYGVFYDASGAIIGYWGLTLGALKHRFRVNSQPLYTWCAWDTLFLPELLDALAEVESACPMTGEAIRLTVSGLGIEAVHPETTVISFVTPDRAKVEQDVLSNFCHYVHFFCSPEVAENWVLQHPGTRVLNLSQAWALAHEKNVAQYGETMALEGRAT